MDGVRVAERREAQFSYQPDFVYRGGGGRGTGREI